jgi:hypothetical protein
MLHLRKKYNILGPVGNNKEKSVGGGEGNNNSKFRLYCGPRLGHYGRVGEQNHVYIK